MIVHALTERRDKDAARSLNLNAILLPKRLLYKFTLTYFKADQLKHDGLLYAS